MSDRQGPGFTYGVGTPVIATHVNDDTMARRGVIVRFEDTEFGFDTPVLRMDDGAEWRGWECWWTKADESVIAAVDELMAERATGGR